MVLTEDFELQDVIDDYFKENSSDGPKKGSRFGSMLNELWRASSSKCADIDFLKTELGKSNDKIEALKQEVATLKQEVATLKDGPDDGLNMSFAATGQTTCNCSQRVSALETQVLWLTSQEAGRNTD